MAGPGIEAVRDAITAAHPRVHVDATTPDLFFFRDQERVMPFATIVARDTAHDDRSRLDRAGIFRLNIGLDRAGFETLFPQYGSRKALEGADIDFSALDTLMPHPVYGRMHWVCVLNPDASWPACRDLVAAAYDRVGDR